MRLREKLLIPFLKGSSALSFYLAELSYSHLNFPDYLIGLGITGASTFVGIHDLYKYMYKKEPMGEYWKDKGLRNYKSFFRYFTPVLAGMALGAYLSKEYKIFSRLLGWTIGASLWIASDHLLTKYNIEYGKKS